MPGRSIVTNASHHVAQDIVINIDLRDFFPTIEYKRVRGMFAKLGYSEQFCQRSLCIAFVQNLK